MSTDSATLLEALQIWNEGLHAAFTDLLHHEGKWFCVFREGQEHASFDGQIRVLVSEEGQTWKSCAVVTMPGADLRDPKLSLTPEGRLMLVAGMRIAQHTGRTLGWFSFDGANWGSPSVLVPDDEWLWRVTWHAGVAYGVAYNWGPPEAPHYLRMYTSRAGRSFQSLGEELLTEDFPNETSLVFREDGLCYALVRRETGSRSAVLGTSPMPYAIWTWQDTGLSLGGPNLLVLPDGRLIAGGRIHGDSGPQTALLWLDPDTGESTPFLTLPSAGDTSYPGLAWYEDVLWVSYYSSHEGPTAIYLARVEVPSS